ncbi:hypothetical protein ACHAXA_004091 [Cyclostephanos tholiformis]|jgi:hypothetical protein|uniref:Uncharacterized protein n=1 Tax=Cyclostephanos tholiformis TaxID=382380 RepID=A0ABD3R398_9STRA
MTPEEILFTNAFNTNRSALALFSKCTSLDELHIVRDAFYLGMASLLCPQEYGSLRESMIIDPTSFTSIANSLNKPNGLEVMITAARASDEWESLLASLHEIATGVNSDLDYIWSTLERGRLEWLSAINAAHPLKVILKDALNNVEKRTENDEVDAKMIYMYALSVSIPALTDISAAWRKIVNMDDSLNPLKNYNADLWDCRHDDWRPLDLGVQEAAERGGSSFRDAWEA